MRGAGSCRGARGASRAPSAARSWHVDRAAQLLLGNGDLDRYRDVARAEQCFEIDLLRDRERVRSHVDGCRGHLPLAAADARRRSDRAGEAQREEPERCLALDARALEELPVRVEPWLDDRFCARIAVALLGSEPLRSEDERSRLAVDEVEPGVAALVGRRERLAQCADHHAGRTRDLDVNALLRRFTDDLRGRRHLERLRQPISMAMATTPTMGWT